VSGASASHPARPIILGTTRDERALRAFSLPVQSSAPAAFHVFAWLWAGGMVSHMVSYSEPLRVETATLFALSVFVLFRPTATAALLALLATHLLYVCERMPRVPNHSLLAAIVDLTILTSALACAWKRRTWRIELRDLYESFAPLVRIELLVLYFFVVFHKLNHGFFDPEVSCGTAKYFRLARGYPFLPTGDWVRPWSIYLTILVEAAIPLMLVLRPLRLAGLLLAFAFHFTLAMDPGDVVFNFSAILLALFSLFLPHDFPAALSSTLEPLRRAWRADGFSRSLRLTAQTAVRASVAALLAALVFRHAIATRLTSESARGVWVFYSAFVLAAFAATFLRNRFRFENGRDLLRVRSWGLVIFPALLVANGLMPYLGGKTEGSFAMFSNLRTEGGYSNHWLMPAWLQVWGYQDDLVRIRRTSIPKVQRLANHGFQWTYFELRSLIRSHPGASIVYERNGVVASWKGARSDPDLTRPENPFLRKFFWFRPVPIDPTKTPCIH
jgi:hypothetical protein